MEQREPSAWRESFRSAALSLGGLFVRQPHQPFLRALYFHSVYDLDRANFERTMRELMRWGSFIDTTNLLRIMEGGQAPEARYFHISFDDGYRNLLRNALPFLKTLKIPALVFVVTERAGQDPTEGPDQRLMSWEELRLIRTWGFEVGSHTQSHPRLSEIAAQELEKEVAESKRAIEDRLGAECSYIAWPGGRRADVDERFFAAVRAVGFKACFGGFRGSVVPSQTNRFSIPRHHLEASWPLSHVRYFAAGHGE